MAVRLSKDLPVGPLTANARRSAWAARESSPGETSEVAARVEAGRGVKRQRPVLAVVAWRPHSSLHAIASTRGVLGRRVAIGPRPHPPET